MEKAKNNNFAYAIRCETNFLVGITGLLLVGSATATRDNEQWKVSIALSINSLTHDTQRTSQSILV